MCCAASKQCNIISSSGYADQRQYDRIDFQARGTDFLTADQDREFRLMLCQWGFGIGWLFVGRLHREILVSWCVRSSMYVMFHILSLLIP